MNRKEFFAAIRVAPFGGALNAEQVQGINAVLDEWDLRGLADTRHLAYMLATDYHETAYTMQAVEEIGKGRGKKYGRADKRTGQIYYGRGLVQLTWYDNYRDMGQLLGLDLLNKPELALNLDIAVQVMFEGMIRGTFTGKKLSTYFTAAKSDWRNARKIINGLDKADAIAGYAKAFHRALVKAESAPADIEPEDTEAEPTTVVSAEVRGDPELWSVQKRLRDMNYPPGELDGAWGGMTSGAISAFINDRELDITPPTSLALFRKVESELKEALSAAEAEHFKRPVSADRAHASAADIAPRFAAVQQTTRSRFWAKVQTIGASISAAFWAAIEWLQSNDHTGPIVDAVQRVPRWAWIGTAIVAVTVISGMIWRSQRKAEQAVIDQYREGKLQT